MSDFNDLSMQDVSLPKKRPTVITVFGILTLVGAGLGILGGLFSLLIGDSYYEQLREMPMYSDDTVDMMMAMQPPKWTAMILLLVAIVKIPAVIQLFKMKRVGFFMYTGAEFVYVIITIMNSIKISQVMSEMGDLDMPGSGMMSTIGALGGIIGIIFTLGLAALWIGIYGSKLKEMD